MEQKEKNSGVLWNVFSRKLGSGLLFGVYFWASHMARNKQPMISVAPKYQDLSVSSSCSRGLKAREGTWSLFRFLSVLPVFKHLSGHCTHLRSPSSSLANMCLIRERSESLI